MNYKTLLKLSVCLLIFSATSFAQSLVDASPTITITGKAELFVEPDFVTFRLEVTKENKDLQIATRETEQVTGKIQAIARKHGLKNEDITIKNISVDKKFRFIQNRETRIFDEDGDEVGTKEFVGYEASTLIVIRVNDLSKFQPLFEELLTSGVDEIDDVTFQTTKLREIKDKARDLAIIAAKEKATAMAGAIGQTVGKAIKINEGSNTSSYRFSSNISSNNSLPFELLREGGSVTRETASTSAYSPGVISVDADVTVTFLLN